MAGAASGRRGRPRTREGAPASAQENLRERSIEKVLEPAEEWDGGGERSAVGAGDWRFGVGKDGRWQRGFERFLGGCSCREHGVF